MSAFEQWVVKAEARAGSVTGLGLDELGAEGHQPGYRDAFDSDYTPREFADEVIAVSGFPLDEVHPTVPAGRRADEVRSNDLRHGATYSERRITGQSMTGPQIRLALDQAKVLGHLPVLYGKGKR